MMPVMAIDGCSSKTVLVVEDDPTLRDLIATVLESEGFEAVPVPDGKQALRAAHDLEPDAITLDLEIPGVDGRSVLRGLRDDVRVRGVPIVVVSAACETLTSQERRQVARALGKPFQVPELVRAVSVALARD
jgi:CheY-like chemotaxis protein